MVRFWTSKRSNIQSYLHKLLLFTINCFVDHQRKDRDDNDWSNYEWNNIFFPIISNACLRCPEKIVNELFLNPILLNWEKAPSFLGDFLRELIFSFDDSDKEKKFFDIWNKIGNNVLSSNLVKKNKIFLNNDIEEIISLLIFTDSKQIIKWRTKELKQIDNIKELIEKWVVTIGHNPFAFKHLISLLKSIGFYFSKNSKIKGAA